MIVYRKINGVHFGVNISKGAGLLCTPEVADQIDYDIYEFIEYLYLRTEDYTPMVATWEITNCCNYSCPFCYINTDAKPAAYIQSFDSMKTAIDDLVEMGLLLVYLTGGEVLSVPDFERIYRYFKGKGVFVVLLTNLSLLSEEHLKLFHEYPPLRITTSIYGMTDKQFSYITGQNANILETVLENVLKLKEMRITVTCQTPVNRYTKEDIVKIADWCYTHNIRFTCSNELTDSYYNESRSSEFISDEDFSIIKAQIKQIPPTFLRKKPKFTKRFGFRYNFDCISGKHTFAVSSDMHIRPCFNIWESDLIAFDGSKSMRAAMQKMKLYISSMKKTVLEGCQGCEASEICSECFYTLQKHKNKNCNYLMEKCFENRKIVEDLF